MTKNELIAAVADKAQMTKTAAASAVDATFDAITSTLKKGGEVKIMGFGNFRVVKRAARDLGGIGAALRDGGDDDRVAGLAGTGRDDDAITDVEMGVGGEAAVYCDRAWRVL